MSIGIGDARLQPFVARPPTGSAPPATPVVVAPALDAALGPLASKAVDGVTDLLIDGRGVLWIDDGEGLRRDPDWIPLDGVAARRLAVTLIAAGGRHLDDATPCADVRLPFGGRVHAVLPPVSTGGPLVSVRIPRRGAWRLADLVAAGMLDTALADRLVTAVHEHRNLLICGRAGTGKTSLLAALLAEAPAHERIVTIEDVAELQIDHPHVVGLESRQPNADGAGAVGLAALVREALRMRPDRLVLGECRGAEVVDLFAALTTGHDGGAGTLHAASVAHVPARLESLGAIAGLDPVAVCRQACSAIDLVVQLDRDRSGRRVDSIGRLVEDARGRLTVEAA